MRRKVRPGSLPLRPPSPPESPRSRAKRGASRRPDQGAYEANTEASGGDVPMTLEQGWRRVAVFGSEVASRNELHPTMFTNNNAVKCAI